MASYNTKTTAYRPANPFAVKSLTMPDTTDNGISTSSFLGHQQIMRTGDTMLVQTQTGAMKRYKIDAERSTNGYIVLLPTDGA